MKSSTGRWVSGDDFFGRDRELQVLEARVRDHNHVLLTGQRRIGKTSIAQELGRQLECRGWVFLFADIEGRLPQRMWLRASPRPCIRFGQSRLGLQLECVVGSATVSRRSVPSTSE